MRYNFNQIKLKLPQQVRHYLTNVFNYLRNVMAQCLATGNEYRQIRYEQAALLE